MLANDDKCKYVVSVLGMTYSSLEINTTYPTVCWFDVVGFFYFNIITHLQNHSRGVEVCTEGNIILFRHFICDTFYYINTIIY